MDSGSHQKTDKLWYLIDAQTDHCLFNYPDELKSYEHLRDLELGGRAGQVPSRYDPQIASLRYVRTISPNMYASFNTLNDVLGSGHDVITWRTTARRNDVSGRPCDPDAGDANCQSINHTFTQTLTSKLMQPLNPKLICNVTFTLSLSEVVPVKKSDPTLHPPKDYGYALTATVGSQRAPGW